MRIIIEFLWYVCSLVVAILFFCCVVARVKEAHNGTKPTSAPCTPCGNRDNIFDMDASGNIDHSVMKPSELSCVASTPKLHQAATHTPHVDVLMQQHCSLDRHRHRQPAVGCSPVELSSQLHQNRTDDVYPAANGLSRRQRRHRPRDRHRSANR